MDSFRKKGVGAVARRVGKYRYKPLNSILITLPSNVVWRMLCFVIDIFICNRIPMTFLSLNILQNPKICFRGKWYFISPLLSALVWLVISMCFRMSYQKLLVFHQFYQNRKIVLQLYVSTFWYSLKQDRHIFLFYLNTVRSSFSSMLKT